MLANYTDVGDVNSNRIASDASSLSSLHLHTVHTKTQLGPFDTHHELSQGMNHSGTKVE